MMGDAGIYPEEGPPHRATVGAFAMDAHEVTNDQFSRFVQATGYVTLAEQAPDPADYPDIPPARLVPGGAVFIGAESNGDPRDWWRFVPGANWRHPTGPRSSIAGRGSYPVVQVAYADALAYARWAGRDLPSEAEWEYAARGGRAGKSVYAWGDEAAPGGVAQANIWQGPFPARDTGDDGYAGLAPAGCFPPNGFGLSDMIGNVWEWTSTAYQAPGPGAAPMVIKGGSYLCAANYCLRYRPPARQPGDTGMGSSHIGFRTIQRPAA